MPSTENKLDLTKSNTSTVSLCKKTAKQDLSKGTVKNHPENKEIEISNVNRNISAIHKKSFMSQSLKNNLSKNSTANSKGLCCKNTQKKKTSNTISSNKSLTKQSSSSSLKTKKVAKIVSVDKPKKNTANDKNKKINGVKVESKLTNGLKLETKISNTNSRTCSSESKKSAVSAKYKEGKRKNAVCSDKGISVCKTNSISQAKKNLPKKNKRSITSESDSDTKRKNCEVVTSEKTHKNIRTKNSVSCAKLNSKEKIGVGKYTLSNNTKTVTNKLNKQTLFKTSCVIQKSLHKNSLIKKGLQSLKSMFGYWNGSRLKRVASLNALAKVHILYENEVRGPSDSDRDENASPKRSDSPINSFNKIMTLKKKCAIKIAQKNNQNKSLETKTTYKKSKESKKGKANNNNTREIITCRRMASLNAQAILAASYSNDRPRRQIKLELENKQLNDEQRTTNATSKPKIIVVKRQKIKTTVSSMSRTENILKKRETFPKKKKNVHQRINGKEKRQKCMENPSRMSQDNTSEKQTDSDVEQEHSEKVEDKAEVTITGVYINPTTNASFCISRVQTYKQSQTYSPPPSPPPSQGQTAVHVQPTPHMMGSVLPSSAHMPTGIYSFPNSMMPSSSNQSYPINGISNVPLVNVALPRHYSSAFTVPHYGHHAPITYAHGFYQPAGPLIQTITDPCLIHKPVPYHPHLQQTSANIFPQERCQGHTTPPQTLQFPHDQCPTHPTPPYSSQPCTQTKCPTIPPAPSSSHFPQDQCRSHPSPQEGFFPEHCPSQGLGTQVYHMPQSFQPTNGSSTYKSPISSCYTEKNENCVQAPTLHVQPKTEQMLMKEENPSQPPVLTPIKPLKLNYVGQILDQIPKTFEGNLQKKAENHNSKPHVKNSSNEKQMPVSSEVSTEVSSQKKTKSECRQLRLEVKTQTNHERQSLPCKRKCIKLLRNDTENTKRRRLITDNGENRFEQKTRLAVYKKSKYSVPQNRCINNTVSVKRGKSDSQDAVNERMNNVPSRTSDHVLPRVSRKPSTGNKTQDQKNAGTHVINSSLVRPVGRSKIQKKNPRFSNGWTWEGEAFDQQIQSHNDDSPVIRKCYPAMRHIEGDIIKCRDCVLLKSGPRKNDLPFVAKIAALWENPDDGEMMISLLWYYRPEHTEQGRKPHHMEDEIFASKHKDVNSVACIEDKCYVLTFNEYCRYRRRVRLLEEGLRPQTSVVPDPEEGYPRKDRQPPGCVSPDMVFFCRKVYDFRQKRILKNPS